jgi:hypothetical protein
MVHWVFHVPGFELFLTALIDRTPLVLIALNWNKFEQTGGFALAMRRWAR